MATQALKQGGTTAASKPAAPPQSSAGEISPYRWIILVGLLLASIMEVLDTTIINVALPQMAGNLGATTTEIGWVSTGYILSNVVVLPMTAFLAQRFGRRKYLIFSIVLFVVASFFCGTSGTLGEIIFWRILQGAGGAALLSTAQATLREIFPPEQQGIVQAAFVLGIVVAPTLGPTLGGYITDNYSWSWCFWINVPLGILSLALVYSFLQDANYKVASRGVDWAGIGLLAVGLASLQYVLEEGNQDDWFEDATILRLSILAAVCLISMFIWELHPRNKAPVVNFRVVKNPSLGSSLLLFLALGFGLYGGIFIFPVFAQNILHFTPTETGLVLLPGGLATGFGVVVCGRLLNGKNSKVDPRFLIWLGMGLFIAGNWMLSRLTTQSGIPDTQNGLLIRGLGLGFLFVPINLVAFSTLKGPEIQQASGLINLTRQLGGSFGIAILSTYISNMTRFHRDHLAENFYSGNPALIERQNALAAQLVTKGYSLSAARQATLGILNGTVQTQASTIAFNNAFVLITIAFVVAVPAVFLLKRGKPGAGGGGDAH